MTIITGIIAEFNPFHKGHHYLLSQAEGIKIVAMSGNWMQRGEPAFFDKWTRAEMALCNGADLVLELPTTVSVQGADFFASGAVDLLAQMGAQKLVFGSESDIDYDQIAQIYQKNQEEMETFIAELPSQMSYPEKTQLMWETFAQVKFDGNTPNHVLALTYAKAAAAKNIQLQAIKRQGQFHSPSMSEPYASATAIRQALLSNQSGHKVIPENLETLYHAPKTSWDSYFPLLQYKIISSALSDIFQMNEELEIRIKKSIKIATHFEQLVELISTKRYTKARVRRLLTYILLNIPRDFELPEKIHVLGFTPNGQKILAQNKEKIITKIGQTPWDTITQKSDAIYTLGNTTLHEQNHGRKPILR